MFLLSSLSSQLTSLELPPVLRWFTANIGVHHVHHLSARIPSYRLGEVLRDHPELRGVNRLTAWDSLRGMRLALWDEDAERLVSFREAHSSSGGFAAELAGNQPTPARGSGTEPRSQGAAASW